MWALVSLEFTGERYVPSLRGQISYEHLHRYAIAASLSSGKRVLDAASGEGYGSALLARVASSVVGVDVDERSVEHARRGYYAANLRFVRASVTELPLADASIDVVASFETIEHLSDHARMLDEMRRVMAPGGVLVISSPNKLVYSDLPQNHNPFHERELYFPEFRDLLVSRFPHVRFYGQRVAASSVVHPLAGATSSSGQFYGGPTPERHGMPSLPDPVYFIAMCSLEPFDLDATSSYLDPSDDLLADMFHELSALRRERTSHATAALTPPDEPLQLPSVANGTVPVAGAQAEASAAEAHAARLRDELAQSQAAFLQADAELTACAAELRHMESRALAAEREAGEAQRARVAAEASMTALEAALADTTGREYQATDGLLERIAMLHADLAAQREAAAVSTAALNAERARANAVAAELNERHARLRAEFDASSRRVNESERLLAERDAANAELEGRLAAAVEALTAAARDSEALRQVLDSRSWKITAPFRRVVRSLRR